MFSKTFLTFFSIFLKIFRNFQKSFRSFRSFENVSRNRSYRDDSFGPKIVEFRAILAICRPFEDRNQNQQTVLMACWRRLQCTSSISTSLDVWPDVQIFKRPKNREDDSKFDNFRTKWIVSARPISGKKFRNHETIEKFSKNFEKFSKKFSKNFSNNVILWEM